MPASYTEILALQKYRPNSGVAMQECGGVTGRTSGAIGGYKGNGTATSLVGFQAYGNREHGKVGSH